MTPKSVLFLFLAISAVGQQTCKTDFYGKFVCRDVNGNVTPMSTEIKSAVGQQVPMSAREFAAQEAHQVHDEWSLNFAEVYGAYRQHFAEEKSPAKKPAKPPCPACAGAVTLISSQSNTCPPNVGDSPNECIHIINKATPCCERPLTIPAPAKPEPKSEIRTSEEDSDELYRCDFDRHLEEMYWGVLWCKSKGWPDSQWADVYDADARIRKRESCNSVFHWLEGYGSLRKLALDVKDNSWYTKKCERKVK